MLLLIGLTLVLHTRYFYLAYAVTLNGYKKQHVKYHILQNIRGRKLSLFCGKFLFCHETFVVACDRPNCFVATITKPEKNSLAM